MAGCAICLAAPATAGARAIPSLGAIADARAYVEAHETNARISFAVVDTRGRLFARGGGDVHRSASQTKAMLLVAYLRRLGDRPVPPAMRRVLAPMIRRSSNRAAHRVRAVVGDAGLADVGRAARMRHLELNGTWSEVGITAADQARFFRRFDRLVPRRHRRYARRLLGTVIERQRFGIPRIAERHGFETFVKGGWRRRLVNQGALLEAAGGRRLSIVVLTSGLKFRDGRRVIEALTRRLLARGAG